MKLWFLSLECTINIFLYLGAGRLNCGFCLVNALIYIILSLQGNFVIVPVTCACLADTRNRQEGLYILPFRTIVRFAMYVSTFY